MLKCPSRLRTNSLNCFIHRALSDCWAGAGAGAGARVRVRARARARVRRSKGVADSLSTSYQLPHFLCARG
jgi:hypothetical protein